MATPGDVAGAVVAGYRIERTIATGLMAVVYEAVNPTTKKHVALKILVPGVMDDRDARVRLARETKASARLRCRHVVRVLDAGELPGGAPYMVMELLEGSDLARELKKTSHLPVSEASAIMVQVACGLAEAHTHGIVHRDVKPSNVFLAREGTQRIAKVIDFGIAKLDFGDEDEELTRSFATLGTPAYMSPEQIREPRAVDRATDVWSFGLVLYRMLAGRLPFSGNASTIPFAICEDTPEDLRAIRPDVPRDLLEAIDGALEKDRRLRPTLADLGDVLIAHVGGAADAVVAHEAYTELARLSLAELNA